MNIYLAGPMRGIPGFNHPAFADATSRLRARGHQVHSPAERDVEDGYDFTGTAGTPADLDAAGFSLRDALAADLHWICTQADAVALLPGWETSLGATAEAATARALGLPVIDLDTLL